MGVEYDEARLSSMSVEKSGSVEKFTDKEDDKIVVKKLLTHVPNSLIYFDYKKDMPATKEFLGIVLFADISGFTKLTECYSTMETSDGTSGTDKLSATLNAYIGMIVEEIIQRNGDVLKFAGDAILATWKCSDIGHNAKTLLNKVINCTLDIQRNCDNFETEVGIVLRVKLAIAVGPMCLTYVGLPDAKQFDLSGSAVDDVGITEKMATPGAVILSQLAWANCDQTLFSVESLDNGKFFKVLGHSILGPNTDQIQKPQNGATTAGLLKTSQKSVTSPLDHLINQLSDYKQDMPKALLLDEDEKITAGRYLTQTVIAGNQVCEKKKKKFDRKTMISNLQPSEIENLRAYVPEPVLYKLDHGQDLEWLSEMRQVSVLFINMKLPDPAKEASEALQKAFEVVYESCTKYKGNLNKVFGFDKGCTFVVIFGLPGQKHEDDPVRALKCALEIFDSIHSIPEIINESIGVTTGLAFTGVVGHKDRHEYTVIGSKVNMAARLMMYYSGILTCDAETYESSVSRLRKHDFIAMPYIELKGLKDPGIIREYNPNSNKKVEDDDFIFPIIGRKAELEKIRSRLSHTWLKNDIVVIEGEAGIGKTRLLEQVMDDGEKEGKRVIHVEGDLSNTQSAGHISGCIVKLLVEQQEHVNRGSVISLVKDDHDIIENIHLLSDLFSVKSHTTFTQQPGEEVGDAERYNQRRRVLLKVIKRITESQSCVFVIDNTRYVDEKSWLFLQDLIDVNPSAMFVFGVRTISSIPNLCPVAKNLLKSHKALQLRLKGLEKNEVVDLVCQLLQVIEVPLKLCEVIQTKSQGVPSWCEQLVKDALYSNTIQILTRFTVVPIRNLNLSKLETPIINVADHPTTEQTLKSSSRRSSTYSEKKYEGRNSVYGPNNECKVNYAEKDYICASEGVVPDEIDEICIITPGADLSSLLVPDSVKDMVLARMDRMTLNEQTVLKCAAVLGQSFTRDLLKAIIPKNCVNMIDTILFNLSKQQFFECGSLVLQSSQARSQSSHSMLHAKASSVHKKRSSYYQKTSSFHHTQQLHHHHHHHHGVQGIHSVQVLCACYAFEGFPLINLSQSNNFVDRKKRVCLYFHFSNTFVQEAAYALWLEDQRKALHEKAAFYLERFSDKCRACGGNGFIPGHGRGQSITEQLRNGSGKRFSNEECPVVRVESIEVSVTGEIARTSRAFSTFIPNSSNNYKSSGNFGHAYSVHDEAARIFKNVKSEHIKNHEIKGTRGEGIGLMLIEMARVLAQTKETAQEKPSKGFRKFGKQNTRVHPSTTVGKLAIRTLIMDFRKSSLLGQETIGRPDVITDSCEVDLSQCKCAELHATILPQLVYYYKAAGNLMKAFHYMIEAASAAVDVNNSMKTMSLLNKVEEIIKQQEENNYKDFPIADEERARIECLKGQALCNMGCLDEGIIHFNSALQLLNSPQPQSHFSLLTRTWRALLVQTLHQKMPGVFTENKRETSIEQIRCLSYLSKAFTMKKNYERAYLANLEQLNAAEEAPENYWNELMTAYTDMIYSCLIFRKFAAGKIYEQLALETAKSASVSIDDMVTLGRFHLTLVSMHLANAEINNALTSAMKCLKIAKCIKDLSMRISIIPFMVQIYLLKLRTQTCQEQLLDYKDLISQIEDRDLKRMYYCCYMDYILDSGDFTEDEDFSHIVEFANFLDQNIEDVFYVNYLRSSLALWYARQNDFSERYWKYWESANYDIEIRHEVFLWRLLCTRTECVLHWYRCQPSAESKTAVQSALKLLQRTIRGKGLFQARLYHFQAYFAFLKHKSNRAKLLLEDCNVASKNNDVGYDLEWALASRREWFSDSSDGVDGEIQYGGMIKYILPPN